MTGILDLGRMTQKRGDGLGVVSLVVVVVEDDNLEID